MQCHRRRQRARCGALAAYSPGRAADLSWRHGADVRRRPGAPAQHGRCRMTPSVDERFASVIRALTEVVLPHLPADASLAQEQVHLSVGHLQILRAPFDETPAFEREEDRKSAVKGKRVSVRVDLGGRRTIKKKK